MTPAPEVGATEFLANLTVGAITLIALILTVVRIAALSRSLRSGARRTPVSALPAPLRSIAELAESLTLAAVFVFLVVRPYFVQAYYIPSASMENTLLGHDAGAYGYTDSVHDHIFVNKLIYRYSDPQRGDIIVFRAPKSADGEDARLGLPLKENVLIKRVIGAPGDTIQARDGAVYRNGARLTEPYIREPMITGSTPDARFGTTEPIHLGPGQYFAMGDNRNVSSDSRYWGPVDRQRVIGKALCIFWPLSRIRLLH